MRFKLTPLPQLNILRFALFEKETAPISPVVALTTTQNNTEKQNSDTYHLSHFPYLPVTAAITFTSLRGGVRGIYVDRVY